MHLVILNLVLDEVEQNLICLLLLNYGKLKKKRKFFFAHKQHNSYSLFYFHKDFQKKNSIIKGRQRFTGFFFYNFYFKYKDKLDKNFLFINFSKFFQQGISNLGKSYKAHVEIVPYLLGIRGNYDISNLRWIYYTYRQSFLFLARSQSYNSNNHPSIYPSIMHIASREELRKQNRMVANYLHHQHISIKWIGGLLTNTRLRDLRPLLGNVREHGLSGKNLRWWNFKQFKRKLELPSVFLIWDTHHNDYAVIDVVKMKIPLLGIVDNLVNPRKFTYPLVGPNFDEKHIAFYQKLFLNFFFHICNFSVNFNVLKTITSNFKLSVSDQPSDYFKNFKFWRKIPFNNYFLTRIYKKNIQNFKNKNVIFKKKSKSIYSNSTLFFKNKLFWYHNFTTVSALQRFFTSGGLRLSFKIFSSFIRWRKIYLRVIRRKILRRKKILIRRRFKKKKFKMFNAHFFSSYFFQTIPVYAKRFFNQFATKYNLSFFRKKRKIYFYQNKFYFDILKYISKRKRIRLRTRVKYYRKFGYKIRKIKRKLHSIYSWYEKNLNFREFRFTRKLVYRYLNKYKFELKRNVFIANKSRKVKFKNFFKKIGFKGNKLSLLKIKNLHKIVENNTKPSKRKISNKKFTFCYSKRGKRILFKDKNFTYRINRAFYKIFKKRIYFNNFYQHNRIRNNSSFIRYKFNQPVGFYNNFNNSRFEQRRFKHKTNLLK